MPLYVDQMTHEQPAPARASLTGRTGRIQSQESRL